MVNMSSCTSLLWLLVCCWCCVALAEHRMSYTGDSEEDRPTKTTTTTRRTTTTTAATTDDRQMCWDRRKNQDESDIDCGGMKCPRCEDMKSCKTDCDCISGSCKNNKCSSSISCEDGIKNQDETDVDCGGILCPKCSSKKTCNSECDCIGGVCRDNKCVDQPHDGGGCKPACKNNGKCLDEKCSCPTGYQGPTCEIESHGLCSAKDLMDSEPILTVTFGNGREQYSKKTPHDLGFTTTYKQKFQPTTDDGEFSLINSIHNDFGGIWHTDAKDHTGDEGGYMFLVDADYKPGELYKQTVKNLCVGHRYEFSVYLANIFKPNMGVTKPNVLFQVRASPGNELLAELTSGEVPEHNSLTWKKYGMTFTATNPSVVLLMISNAPGGSGNDFAIDDITLRGCGKGSGLCPGDE